MKFELLQGKYLAYWYRIVKKNVLNFVRAVAKWPGSWLHAFSVYITDFSHQKMKTLGSS
jgi:hypothetical protein